MTGGDGLFLGVDVGTSATRVSLVRPDASGGIASAVTASAGYRTVRGGDGQVEQDPAAWSRALATALRRARLDGGDLRAVTAVGLCGQTPTLVLADAAGRPVRAALTWQDTRATAEAAELAGRFGDPEPLIGTALPWSAANLPAKLAWLARYEPDTARRTRWLLQPKDFVAMQLSGAAASDPWSSKGICRVSDGAPAAEVLASMRAGADAVKLFPVGSMGGAGYLRALREPLPGLRAVVSGGIAAGEVRDYLAAGADAVCLGGALIDREAARRGDVDAVAAWARAALDRISAV